jgi:pimeloyl-ACP methyl ester carboxylesterase
VGTAAFYRQIAQAEELYTEEVEELYPTVSSRVLLLWGKEDSWTPVDRDRKLNRMIPTSRLQLIRNAGHLVIEERPEALLRHILDFLSPPGRHLGD